MKLLRKLHWVAFGAFILAAAPQANANQGLTLNETIQQTLMTAEPVRGQAVDKQIFNGKPVLVTFFASW
ncbi:MAG: hypothetical protein O3A84_13640 [Proteobacteria bacterium]|nr:hypothetical protein [Pseudomonadota bacterium]